MMTLYFLAQAPWQYPADLHLIYWLETMGYEYDVFTDEDITEMPVPSVWVS
jgi:N,N-dimethylformamidase